MIPLVPVVRPTTLDEGDKSLIRDTAELYGISLGRATALLLHEIADEEIWVNDKYQVAVRRFDHPMLGRQVMHINIRRRDGKVIMRDWREFQAIKDQLADPEFEAVELYPAHSRMVDSSNKYHLWVVLDRDFRWPIGFADRDVQEDRGSTLAGHRQRKLPPGWSAEPRLKSVRINRQSTTLAPRIEAARWRTPAERYEAEV